MTKTIKRSLIVVLMLVFAVTAAFTATFTVKADETPDPAVVAAGQFKSIVDAWKIEDLTSIDILADIDSATAGDQWLIDSAAKAREMYADGKSVIDSVDTYADAKEKYDAVMVACDDALDFQAEINELVEALKVTSKVVIFGSEELHVNTLENTYNNVLDDDEVKYIDSKFVNETVKDVIDAVQAKIADIHAKGAEAEIAIANIVTFDVEGKTEKEALYGSKATLDKAIDALEAIYGKPIEEVFEMNVRVAGDVYKEDATKVALYVSNIKDYVELKAEYDAQVAIAQGVVGTINELTATVANTDAAYKFLANEDSINALVEDYKDLDTSVENNLKAYVDEAVKYLDNKGTEDPADDVYASKYQDLLDGIYEDQIQELVDLVLALPEVENDILGLKDALDNYRAKFSVVSVEQQNAVNAEEAPAPYNTIKNMYEYYNELSTQPWAMVQYAINAIDAIELNAEGEFVMSVETVAQLVNAQQKYANVPADYKKYVTNSDKLLACEAKMEEDLVAVKEWAKQVVAIAENAPITVTNWKDVEAAVATFTDDILEEIQEYIATEEAFRAFTLKGVEGVEEDQPIQYYFDLFKAEVVSAHFLNMIIDEIARSMNGINVVVDLDEDYDYAMLPQWIAMVDAVESFYAGNIVIGQGLDARSFFDEEGVLVEDIWNEFVLNLMSEELVYIGVAYGDDTRAYLAEGYGAFLKAQYDAAAEADKADYDYYNFFENYTNALAIRERYQVELAIEALTDAADITIVDEYDLLVVRSYFEALDEENEDVLCGQDAVRNIEKLEACEEALGKITDKLDAFVAAVKALGDDATKLDLVAYQDAQDIRLTLTADELNYTGVYPSISMLAEGEADGIDFARDVDAAVAKIDELREAAIENINELTDALLAVTGEKDEFVALYEDYMDLHASQRDKANEAILAPDASIEDLVDAYIYAGTVANTDWLYSVSGKVEELQDELDSKVEELQNKLDAKVEELQDKIDELTAAAATKEELEDAIAALEADIAAIEADIAAIEANIDAIETEIDEAVAAIETEIDGVVEAFEESIEAVEGKIAALKTEAEGKIAALKTELEGKINTLKTDLEGAIADLEAELKALIKAEADAREEADAELQEQIDSTRTLAIVGLVIAIVALCAAAFVIVYKVILKK